MIECESMLSDAFNPYLVRQVDVKAEKPTYLIGVANL